MTEHFPYFRKKEKDKDPSWKNAIRHNLSLNTAFVRLQREKGDMGKGGYWSLVPQLGEELVRKSVAKRRRSEEICFERIDGDQDGKEVICCNFHHHIVINFFFCNV